MRVHPRVVGGQVHDVITPGQVRDVDARLLRGLAGRVNTLVISQRNDS